MNLYKPTMKLYKLLAFSASWGRMPQFTDFSWIKSMKLPGNILCKLTQTKYSLAGYSKVSAKVFWQVRLGFSPEITLSVLCLQCSPNSACHCPLPPTIHEIRQEEQNICLT